MSYREMTMIDVKELLRRWAAGQSNRRIARDAGADRGTVARYIAVAEQIGLAPDRELTEGEVHEVAQRVQARPVPDASAEWLAVATHKARIEEWLGKKRPLRLSKVHVLLVRDHGLEASYDTLRRYAQQELGWRRRAPTIRLDDPPAGQEAQVDFGKMGAMLDPAAGRVRALWALVVTLSFSRYQFVWPTFVQTTEAVCEGLDHAWWFFAAMTKTIIPDNTKAIVKDPDALSPVLVAAFLDYVQARGIFVDPARIRSPKDKPRVENQVPYVRESRRGAPKLCLADHGLRASWLGEVVPLDPAALDVAPDLTVLAGHIAESVVGATLASVPTLDTFWLAEAGGEPEVDFVLVLGTRRIPLEVKYQRRIDPLRDTEGLRTFVEKAVNNAPFGVLVTQADDVSVDDPRIVALPLSSLLLLR